MFKEKTKGSFSLIGISSLIIVLVVLIVAIVFILIRNDNLNNITEDVKTLGNPDSNLEMVKVSIQKLNETDNNFRLYTLSYKKENYDNYLEGLAFISQTIDALKKSSFEENKLDPFETTFQDKKSLEASYLKLKVLTDSILIVSFSIDSVVAENILSINRNYATIISPKDNIVIDIDTVFSANTIETVKKPGLIGKLFGQKVSTEVKQDIVINSQSSPDSVQNQNAAADSSKNGIALLVEQIKEEYSKFYTNKLNNFSSIQKLLENNEKDLILINMKLLGEVGEVLRQLELQYSNNIDQKKQNAIFDISSSIRNISLLVLGSFIIILVLITLILFNVRNVFIANAKLNKAKEKAEEEGKAKEKFLGYMSHELRTPLFAISGFVEQLKFTPLDKNQEQYVSILQQSIETLLLTANDILDHSSLNAGKHRFVPEEFTIKQLMGEIRLVFQSTFVAKNMELEVKVSENQDLVMSGDTFRLKQIFNNLISNALKYSDEGKVTVECLITQNNETATLNANVIDRGIGIPKEAIEELFEEYTQVYDLKANWRQGTGLGLSICKRLLEQQGGKIWAESELGKGSVFSFEIIYPIVEKPGINISETKIDIDVSKLKGLKVLFVDDNQINILLFKTMMSKWDTDCHTALNGIEALKLINKNYYDIIFTDVFMPKMNGVELTKEIRSIKEKADIPIITVTADVMKKDVDYYKNSGMTDYLFKPFKSFDLFNMLTKYYSPK